MNFAALHKVGPRLVALVGGEAMQSAFHLGLNLALLHAVTPYEYGIFALVMVIGGLGLTYIRSLTALPASIAIGRAGGAAAGGALEISFGAAAALLSLLLTIVLVLVLETWLDEGAVTGGAFVGLWMMRSHLRTVFFARRRQNLVSLSDLVFTVSGAAGAGLVLLNGTHILEFTFLVTALANALGIAVLLVLAGPPLRLRPGRHLWRRYRRLWGQLRWSLLSVTITNVQGQGMALLVGALAGPAAYAPIAAALVMFVPLRIVGTAFANMMHPEFTALVARGDAARLRRLMLGWLVPLGGVAVLYLMAMLLALPLIQPDSLEHGHFYLMAIIAWLMSGMPLFYVSPRIFLESSEDFRSIAQLSGLAAVLGLSLVLVIVLSGAPSWALLGGALSEVVVLAGSWVLAIRGLRALRS
jgi:O-antigen/teichoic acid export membrane protein